MSLQHFLIALESVGYIIKMLFQLNSRFSLLEMQGSRY